MGKFKLKMPKALKKWKPGKTLVKLASALPVVGNTVDKVANFVQKNKETINTIKGTVKEIKNEFKNPNNSPGLVSEARETMEETQNAARNVNMMMIAGAAVLVFFLLKRR